LTPDGPLGGQATQAHKRGPPSMRRSERRKPNVIKLEFAR